MLNTQLKLHHAQGLGSSCVVSPAIVGALGRLTQQASGQSRHRQRSPTAGALSNQAGRNYDMESVWTARARTLLGVAAAVKHSEHQRTESQHLYDVALDLSRQEDHEGARMAFEVLLKRHPHFTKAWVSYAQMEKRIGRTNAGSAGSSGAAAELEGLHNCRQVLQRGLRLNPDSACLAQAWGLMELQKGNLWAAVRLLERCVIMDPACSPVLRWRHVDSARQSVMCCKGRRSCVIAAGAGSSSASLGSGLSGSGGAAAGAAAPTGGWRRGGAAGAGGAAGSGASSSQ